MPKNLHSLCYRGLPWQSIHLLQHYTVLCLNRKVKVLATSKNFSGRDNQNEPQFPNMDNDRKASELLKGYEQA